MCEEDVLEIDQTYVGAEQLPLRALAAVDENPIAAAPNERRRCPARSGRRRRGCPQEDELEVHGSRS